MYYAHPMGPPMPSKPLYEANFSERAMWEYQYGRHQDAIQKMRSSVDNTKPKCDDPKLEEMRRYTRRFADHERCREIGRQNQQLVRRLYEISEGRGGRGQPGAGGPPSLEKLRAPRQLPKLRHDSLRRKVQREIEWENEGLVKRLMSVKTTLNLKKLDKDFKRHLRTGQLRSKIQPYATSAPMERGGASSSLPRLQPRPQQMHEIALGPMEKIASGDTREYSTPAASRSAPALPTVKGAEASGQAAKREELLAPSSWPEQTDPASQTRRWVTEEATAGPQQPTTQALRVRQVEAEEAKVAEKVREALQEDEDAEKRKQLEERLERARTPVHNVTQQPQAKEPEEPAGQQQKELQNPQGELVPPPEERHREEVKDAVRREVERPGGGAVREEGETGAEKAASASTVAEEQLPGEPTEDKTPTKEAVQEEAAQQQHVVPDEVVESATSTDVTPPVEVFNEEAVREAVREEVEAVPEEPQSTGLPPATEAAKEEEMKEEVPEMTFPPRVEGKAVREQVREELVEHGEEGALPEGTAGALREEVRKEVLGHAGKEAPPGDPTTSTEANGAQKPVEEEVAEEVVEEAKPPPGE